MASMKLLNFEIKGFKSIIDSGECRLSENDNITVLAGQNEAGKSAILEALDFFCNGPGTDFIKFQLRMDEAPVTEVICTFEIDDDDLENIKEGFNDEKLDKFFNEHRRIRIKRTGDEKNIKTPLEIIDGYFSPLIKILQEIPPNVTPLKEGEQEPTPAVDTEPIINALIKNITRSIPKFTLYRSFKDFLPSEINVSAIPSHPAVVDFEQVFSISLASLARITDPRRLKIALEKLEKRITDDFNTSWSQKLDITDEVKYQFVITVKPPETIVFMIKGVDSIPLYLEQKSMGFRWFSAFHLRLRAIGADSASLKNFVLLVDEPGQNLHETAQEDAKKVLEELASKGAQIIYSTHNAKLIGIQGAEFARIRLVSNSKERGTKVETVSQFTARDDQGSKDALSPIRTAMGLSVNTLIEKDKYNVVVEGITDHYYLSAFKKLLHKNSEIYFIPSCGVNNLPSLVSILLGWGFNYKAVFDDDKNSGRRAYDNLKKQFYENSDDIAHEHIMKIKGCNGIEDIFSTKDFYKHVLNQKIPTTSGINSELAKGKKEIIARQFLERVNKDENITLDAETQEKIEKIFSWLYEKFKIKEP